MNHGGSYFEEVDWWTKKPHFNLLGELKFMVPEMLFLKGLYEFNRKLWYRSFPFHFGLYLLIGALGLLGARRRAIHPYPSLMAGPLGTAGYLLYKLMGMAGLALAVLGALGLAGAPPDRQRPQDLHYGGRYF